MTIWIPGTLSPELPKYKSLAQRLAKAIDCGELKPGDQLPTHRALADHLGVTVGTVTRAYAEAEKQLLIESKVGSGTYVRDENKKDFQIRPSDQQAQQLIDLSYSFALDMGQEQELAEILASLSQSPSRLKSLLDYQSPQGLEFHRQAGEKWLEITGINSQTPDNLLITNGGQHGFSCVTNALCRAGDTVLSAGITYPGFSQLAQQMGLRHLGLESDSQGILPDALKLACQRYQPKLLYVNSRINNPSCEQMGSQRIDALAEIARQFNVHVIDDDIQGCLLEPSTPTFINQHPDITSLVTGTSKAICGGLRVGYLLPAKSIARATASAIQTSCWMPAPLMVDITSQWIVNGTAQQFMRKQKIELEQRIRMILGKLKPYTTCQVKHGLNIWLELPEHRRAEEFCQSIERQNVLAKPSSAFAVGHFSTPQAIRFCVGGKNNRARLFQAVSIIAHELTQPSLTIDHTH